MCDALFGGIGAATPLGPLLGAVNGTGVGGALMARHHRTNARCQTEKSTSSLR
jgi:hypothetical protein